MINKFGMLNGAEYFSSGISQNYFVFIPATKWIKYFHDTTFMTLSVNKSNKSIQFLQIRSSIKGF